MATTAYDLKALRRLSVAERIQLVEDLWDSIAEDDPDAAFPVTPELAKELDRRLASHERGPSAAQDWRVVRRRITDRLRTQRKKSASASGPRRKKVGSATACSCAALAPARCYVAFHTPCSSR